MPCSCVLAAPPSPAAQARADQRAAASCPVLSGARAPARARHRRGGEPCERSSWRVTVSRVSSSRCAANTATRPASSKRTSAASAASRASSRRSPFEVVVELDDDAFAGPGDPSDGRVVTDDLGLGAAAARVGGTARRVGPRPRRRDQRDRTGHVTDRGRVRRVPTLRGDGDHDRRRFGRRPEHRQSEHRNRSRGRRGLDRDRRVRRRCSSGSHATSTPSTPTAPSWMHRPHRGRRTRCPHPAAAAAPTLAPTPAQPTTTPIACLDTAPAPVGRRSCRFVSPTCSRPTPPTTRRRPPPSPRCAPLSRTPGPAIPATRPAALTPDRGPEP